MIYAMKILRKDAIIARNQVKNAKSERSILSKLDHPFLVGLKFAFQTDDKLYLVLDYVNGGELFYHLQRERRFPEDRVRLYAAEIVLGLGFLHSQEIIYRYVGVTDSVVLFCVFFFSFCHCSGLSFPVCGV